MKIVVRHEVGDDDSLTTCVWAVGDDGETIETAYLAEGEQVDVNVTLDHTPTSISQRVEFGEVGPIAKPDADDESEEASAPPKDEDPPPATGDSGQRGEQQKSKGGDGSTTK